ncbi:hypothetical protein SAMN02800692_1540 [Luteibacter sp. UNC138MFCol5.1]|uniref:Pyocin large subunit n=1 Tax=Luteibacter sp. UNC138MFCol5.1 TaxID=1502774 RepID=UPI0008C713F2|nr:Pyocin large subunit [Luteibacter sp. UNC138MFCol5.1]SEO63851.1 hypothetical protein SAMN02800692_1540 [Luteibacter sp. UNC138MFCol5.1]
MAGDWIKMRSDLFTHPKVVRMASALKADRLRVVGGLMSVWCLFDAHSADGKIEGYDFGTVDELLNWPGFAASMSAVNWLAQDGESLVLPDFDKHNGQSAKRRAQDADRKREVRKTSASNADAKRTREEKRREEKEQGATASAPTLELVSDERGQGDKPPSKRGTRLPDDWQPSDEDVQWARAERPDVDLRAELASFRDYWRAKPGADAVKLDWSATLRNWIRRASPSRSNGGGRQPNPVRPRRELTREIAR